MCKYCKGDKPLFQNSIESLMLLRGLKVGNGFSNEKWEMRMASPIRTFSVHVNYCPMCGKKLGDAKLHKEVV